MKDDEYKLFEPGIDMDPGTINRREFFKLMGGGIFILFSVRDPLAPPRERRRR